MASGLPNEGDILQGTIVRIEPYGAFCRLQNARNLQGLIHISQLASDQRVEHVEDVVSVDDQVWVKILKVEMDPKTQRWKIQLSRKDVSQDGMATDLGRERETRENQRNQLESNLNSMIGMGVARDPMADRLIMKSDKTRQGITFWGGYSLVGEDEGEVQVPLPEPPKEPSSTKLPPLGRGRGATLPAWMTQTADGPTGKDSDDESNYSSTKKKKKVSRRDSQSDRKRKKKHHSHKRKRESRREKDEDDSSSISHRDKRRKEEGKADAPFHSDDARDKRHCTRTSRTKSHRRHKNSSDDSDDSINEQRQRRRRRS